MSENTKFVKIKVLKQETGLNHQFISYARQLDLLPYHRFVSSKLFLYPKEITVKTLTDIKQELATGLRWNQIPTYEERLRTNFIDKQVEKLMREMKQEKQKKE